MIQKLIRRPWIFGIVAMTISIALIVSTAFLTLYISHRSKAKSYPNSPTKAFPEFTGNVLHGSLKTEQVDGIVHFQLEATTTKDFSEDFRHLLNSKLRPFLKMHLALQDAAGFTVCEQEISHDQMIATESNGASLIQVNSTIPCEPDEYARIEKWVITSNIRTALETLPKLTSDSDKSN